MEDEMFEPDMQEFFQLDPESEEQDIKEICRKLEDSGYLEEIRTSAAWEMFRNVWHRIYKQAEVQLDNVRPDDTAKISELQITKRFYRDVLATMIRKIREDGKAAYEQAQDRGLLNKISLFAKKDKGGVSDHKP